MPCAKRSPLRRLGPTPPCCRSSETWSLASGDCDRCTGVERSDTCRERRGRDMLRVCRRTPSGCPPSLPDSSREADSCPRSTSRHGSGLHPALWSCWALMAWAMRGNEEIPEERFESGPGRESPVRSWSIGGAFSPMGLVSSGGMSSGSLRVIDRADGNRANAICMSSGGMSSGRVLFVDEKCPKTRMFSASPHVDERLMRSAALLFTGTLPVPSERTRRAGVKLNDPGDERDLGREWEPPSPASFSLNTLPTAPCETYSWCDRAPASGECSLSFLARGECPPSFLR
mmetsp:Transcript_5254/g.12647  ORF Transcript_5254/g.12647 Transcript_5254/m.12647 type:complete len:287 (-) Transcript_5254:94-954(-)